MNMTMDRPVGRVLNRREALALLAGASAALVVGAGSASASGSRSGIALAASGASAAVTVLPSCVVRPALTEGPYFVDEGLNRSDIRSNPADGVVKEGAKLALTFLVSGLGANSCSPLAGAQVDVWHCDALGVYSDVADPGFNTRGQEFLRGYQMTNASGVASFTTIYPGWYQGRAVHIHFKIRVNDSEFTSQLFFDDNLTDVVHAEQPYSRKGQRTLRNSGDGIYRNGGSQLLLDVQEDGSGGYAATFTIGLEGVSSNPAAATAAATSTATPAAGGTASSYTFPESGY